MWQCLKCGRTFKTTNQSHLCGEPQKAVDDYISNQPSHVQLLLSQVRDTIREVLPDAEERIAWGMPTFWNNHNIIHFAALKNHLGIYPGPDAIEHFKEELKDYKTSKGSIQLPYNKPLPLKIVADIATWCNETGNHP